jgi:hypothetical protein
MDCSAPDLARDTAVAFPFTAAGPREQALINSRCDPAGPCGSDSACAPVS